MKPFIASFPRLFIREAGVSVSAGHIYSPLACAARRSLSCCWPAVNSTQLTLTLNLAPVLCRCSEIPRKSQAIAHGIAPKVCPASGVPSIVCDFPGKEEKTHAWKFGRFSSSYALTRRRAPASPARDDNFGRIANVTARLAMTVSGRTWISRTRLRASFRLISPPFP